jgi:hypothetical protein
VALLIGLPVALAVLCPERLKAQEAARGPAKAAMRRLGNQSIVMNNGRPEILPEWIEVDVTDDEPGWRASVSDAAFDQLIFGPSANAEVVRQNLDVVLREDLEYLTDKYGLTAVQKQKLHLAGKGDLERLFDEVEDFRRAAQSQVIREVADLQKSSKDFSRESARLRPKIHTGPFGKGSLLAKTLKGSLTADQIAAYETWKQDRSAVVTRSWDLRVR